MADRKEPDEITLGAALARLDVADREAASIVRAYLRNLREKSQEEDGIDRLISMAVHPVWRAAIDVVGEHNAIRGREVDATIKLAQAYAERTTLWREAIIPKLVPLGVSLAAILLAALAALLGIPMPGGPS